MLRVIDFLLSFTASFLLVPLLLPVILILRLTGEGEIFFVQTRIGQYRVPFNLLKFATMLKASPEIGTGTVTTKNDPRVLPVGRILRKTKINELPQIFNVLTGDMSIVGPRPLTQQTFAAYSEESQSVIAKVKPGLSGIGSIVFRGEEDLLNNSDNAISFYEQIIAPYKAELECWFVGHKDLKTYLAVIGATIWVVVFPGSGIVWKVFNNLPKPPMELVDDLKYPG